MSNNWDVNYMRKIAGLPLPLTEWDTDPGEAQAARAEATESGIGMLLKQLKVSFPVSVEAASQIANRVESLSNDTGYGSTISSEDVMEYLESRQLIR